MSYLQTTVLATCMACGEDRAVPAAPDYPPVCARCCERLVEAKNKVEREEEFLRRVISETDDTSPIMCEIRKYLDVLDALRGGGELYVHTRERADTKSCKHEHALFVGETGPLPTRRHWCSDCGALGYQRAIEIEWQTPRSGGGAPEPNWRDVLLGVAVEMEREAAAAHRAGLVGPEPSDPPMRGVEGWAAELRRRARAGES